MKTFHIFLVIFCSVNLCFAQSKAAQKKAKQEKLAAAYVKTKTLITSGVFQFKATWATPLDNDAVRVGMQLTGGNAIFQGGRVNLIGNTNFVDINGNESHLFLPYFGRLFFPRGYVGARDNGIEFKGQIEDVSIKCNDKKRRIDYKFKANKKNDALNFHFAINSDGSTRLVVYSTNRQSISYIGKVDELKK